MKARILTLGLLLAPLSSFAAADAAAPAAPAPPPRYFPLDLGKAWTYSLEGFADSQRIVKVLAVDENGLTHVSFWGNEVEIDDRQSQLDIVLGGEARLSYYRFAEDKFLHYDIFDCDSKRTISRTGLEKVVTPAGVFEDCLRLEYVDGGQCADAGTSVEWWALEVGRVAWIEESIIGPRRWVLESYEGGTPIPSGFRRGDANGSSTVNISDAVFILTGLFLGGPLPDCLDTGDTNDDGGIDVADAIFVLGFLFLGGEPPPAPGPLECGKDPTDDGFTDCKYSVCGTQ